MTYSRDVGLPATGSMKVEINIHDIFQLSPEERELVFSIVDAIEKFTVHCHCQREGRAV